MFSRQNLRLWDVGFPLARTAYIPEFLIDRNMELFEFKFYKSYCESFDKIPDEDAGKLIKRMYNFYFNWKDKKSDSILVEAIFSQIKYTMEKSIQGKATWGKRNTTPNRVPSTPPSTKDKDKVKDKVKDNTQQEFDTFILENIKTVQSAYLLKAFYNLWYKNSKDETVETYRKWFTEKILDKYKFADAKELERVIDNFETYWLWEKRTWKENWKSKFMNNPYLKDYAK